MAVQTPTRRDLAASTDDVSLRITMSADLSETLTETSEELGISRAEALMKAIILLKVATQARREGKAFGIADHADVLTEEIVGLGPPQAD